MTNDTQISSHQQLLLPAFYPAYFGTDVPDLRLALHRIINNPRTQNRRNPAMTSTPHLIDHWFWLPRCVSWQGLYLTELQKQLTRVPRLNSGEINLTISADP